MISRLDAQWYTEIPDPVESTFMYIKTDLNQKLFRLDTSIRIFSVVNRFGPLSLGLRYSGTRGGRAGRELIPVLWHHKAVSKRAGRGWEPALRAQLAAYSDGLADTAREAGARAGEWRVLRSATGAVPVRAGQGILRDRSTIYGYFGKSGGRGVNTVTG